MLETVNGGGGAPCQEAKGASGDTITGQCTPLKVTLVEKVYGGDNEQVRKKWIYAFVERELVAEIQAVDDGEWNISVHPNLDDSADNTVHTTAGYVTVDENKSASKGYRFFLSPVRLTSAAVSVLKAENNLEHLPLHKPTAGTAQDPAGRIVVEALDYFRLTEDFHRTEYLPALHDWEAWVENEERQQELFIATQLQGWIGKDDPGDIKDCLKSEDAVDDFIKAYEQEEKTKRTAAEQAMAQLAEWIRSPQHMAIDLATQGQDVEALAVGLLHTGIVYRRVTATAPGRGLVAKVMKEAKTLPATHLFSEKKQALMDSAFSIFKKTWAASLCAFTELLPAKIKSLRKAVGEGRSNAERIQLYLRNLSVETDLKGNYKILHERLERGQGITHGLGSSKKDKNKARRLKTTYQKLVKKADAEIPKYDDQATRTLATADRVEGYKASAEFNGKLVGFALQAVTLCLAIEDYREAFPEAKKEKLLSMAGSGCDFFDAAAGLVDEFVKNKRAAAFLGVTAGAAGFVSGVIDMLDAEEKAVQAAMNRNDWYGCVGHGITMVGASMTAIAAGVIIAKGVSGGALFGGPFGAIVGGVGAGLMALGMVFAAAFSDSDYQTFARHCFLGEDHGTRVDPEWAVVPFGQGSIRNEVDALYDLAYRFKVEVYIVATSRAVAKASGSWTEYEAAGVEMRITPGVFEGDSTQYEVDLELRDLSGTPVFLSENDLILPDPKTDTSTDDSGRVTALRRFWPRTGMKVQKDGQERVPNKKMHRYKLPVKYEVRVKDKGHYIGQPVKGKGRIGGKERTFFGTMEWNKVELR